MKQLHKYLVASFLRQFLLTFALALIVLMLNFVWLYIDELVGKGLEGPVIFELFSYLIARLIPNALILGILLASVMTYGNLGEHNELTAIKTSGISLNKAIYPILVVVTLLGFFSAGFANYVIPTANMKFFTLMRDIKVQRPEIDIIEDQFYNGIEGYSIYVGDKTKDGTTLYKLMIYDHSSGEGNTSLTLADSAYMRVTEDESRLVLTLFNGTSSSEQLSDDNNLQDSKPFRRDNFFKQEVVYALPGSELERSPDSLFKDHYQMLNIRQLRKNAKDLQDELVWRRNKVGHELIENHYLQLEDKKKAREDSLYYDIPGKIAEPDYLIRHEPESEQREIYRQALDFARSVQTKLTDSNDTMVIRKQWANMYLNQWNRILVDAFGCIVFLLIGAPLGAYIKKGGLGSPVLVSIVVFILYFIIGMSGEKYARAAVIPSWLGMWSGAIILFPLAVYLIFKSNNDSEIVNREKSSALFDKLIRK